MISYTVEELKQRVDELLRHVRDEGETVELTDAGRVVARVIPAVDEADRPSLTAEAWIRAADATARRIGKRWPKGASAVDAVREQRRDL